MSNTKKTFGNILLITNEDELLGPFKGEIVKMSRHKIARMYLSKIYYNLTSYFKSIKSN